MSTKTTRILVAEDQDSLRQMVMVALQLDGHQVDTAENGQVALERLSHHHYDLLLTDWRMPQLDGRSLILETRQVEGGADLPVVVLSCLEGPDEDRPETLKIDRWLRKPCRISEIQQAVKDVLRREH
ncbi:MAG: response regulator [Desulfuromonadales bacterium]|nr:response regulator [Desulfuromonadales bacterium]